MVHPDSLIGARVEVKNFHGQEKSFICEFSAIFLRLQQVKAVRECYRANFTTDGKDLHSTPYFARNAIPAGEGVRRKSHTG